MSADIIDFGARLAAIRLGLQTAQPEEDTADSAALYHDIESNHLPSHPSGQVDLMELQSALRELRAELIKKQVELSREGIDLANARSIGAQADGIMRQLTKLAGQINTLKPQSSDRHGVAAISPHDPLP